MPSSSHSVVINGWKTISPWLALLGLNLIAIPSLAIDLPKPTAPPDQSPESSSVSSESSSELSSELSLDLPARANADEAQTLQMNPLAPVHAVDRQSRETLFNFHSHQPVADAPAPQSIASTRTDQTRRLTVPSADRATDRATDRASAKQPIFTPQVQAASVVAAADEILLLEEPEVAVTSDQCLADCNPTEQFNFNAPTNIAIPPRSTYPRPFLAEAVPWSGPASPSSSPSSSPSTLPSTSPSPSTSGASSVPLPLPLSTPQPVQPVEPAFAEAPSAPDPTDATVETSSRALTPPSLQFQGVYIFQGDEDSARLRVTGVYPILPELQIGGTLDFTEGDVFSADEADGLQVNELYVAASLPNYPNLRLIVGQIDLTSYFDRNSFAKDSATQFFNPLFATNPALSAAGIGSRQGAVVNWTIIDELEVKAAVFSSDRSISDFELNAFAGEIGARLGNLIVRGTYSTAEDAGANTSFEEAFSIERSNGEFGLREGDREDGYGVNAEYFIPEINLGLFARYGWYENRDLEEGGSTYSFGINLLDLFMEGDRLGLAYGQELSSGDDPPDVFEAFYDFRIFDSLRLGVTFQGLDGFSESIAGFRIRADFDLVPRRNP